MKAKWKKSSDGGSPQALINELEKHINISKKNDVSFRLEYIFPLDSLFGKIEHSFDLDHDSLFSQFKKTITELYKKEKNLDQQKILQLFSRKCNLTLSRKSKYKLLTSINLPIKNIPKRRTVNGCTLYFSKSIPKKYKTAREDAIKLDTENKLSEQKDYIYVIISVEAINHESAFVKGMNSLDIIRGIWQLGFVKNINFLHMENEHKYRTDSTISIGKVHTIHHESGRLVNKDYSQGIWYQKDYIEKPLADIRNFSVTENHLDTQLKNIRKSPFSDHIFKCITNYINSLDHSDQEFRFMKLNTTLEKIVDTDDTRTLIKRVSFFYKNRSFTKASLESLRQARNISVHVGAKPYNVELKNFQICLYINDLMRFFIKNPFKYEKLSDVIKFISLPTSLETIDEEIEKLKMVKVFIGSE